MQDIGLSKSRVTPATCLILATLLAIPSARAETVPTRKACDDAIAHARLSVAGLDPASMSRRFAENDLVQAKSEGGNGEFDDCLDYAAKAEDEVRHPHHALAKAAPHR